MSRNLRPERLQACPVYLSLGPSPTHRQERSTGPTRFNLASGPPGEVPLASPCSRRPYPTPQARQEGRSRVLSRESVIGVGDYFFPQFFNEVPRKPRPAAMTSTVPVETVSPPIEREAQYRRKYKPCGEEMQSGGDEEFPHFSQIGTSRSWDEGGTRGAAAGLGQRWRISRMPSAMA